MRSGAAKPGRDATGAHRPELYERLRKRNERRAGLARLKEAQRKRAAVVDRVIQLQRTHRLGGPRS